MDRLKKSRLLQLAHLPSEIRIGLNMPIMGPILAVIAIIASATQAYKIELTL